MVIAVFKGSDIARVYDLWQWDYGQKLRIQGLDLPTAVEIHFSLTESSGESITRVGNTVDGVTDVIIPDSMLENETALQSTYNIYAFIYLTDDTSGETVKKIVMEVKTRPKPEAFDAPEDAELFREAIQAVNDAADRAKVSETNASDSAASAQSDAAKTTADRLEVERLVQSVSGIEDEVKVVEQYKEQAIQAAQTAGTSEQNAKASETAAQVAQKAAESAKALTEQYKTAAAESANTSVQAAANAEESARSAEQSASQTAQIAQAAVQNIEQAGSDQVNAVNDAGENQKQAVNSVGTSQVEAVTNAGVAQVEEVNSAGEEKVEEIQQKGQQVLDSIPQDYNTAMAGKLDKQQGAENAGKVMTVGKDGNLTPTDAPHGMTTEQKQQLDKATADIKDLYNTKANAIMDTLTGNTVVLQTVGEGLDLDIEMPGWTRQNQYEGNQLFDASVLPTTSIGGATVTNNDDGSFTVNGSGSLSISYNGYFRFSNEETKKLIQVGKKLYLKNDVSVRPTFHVLLRNTENLPYKTILNGNGSIDISETEFDNGEYLEVRFYGGKDEEIKTGTVKPMLYQDGDGTWEPFVGIDPSPSPEYQQDIVNAGKYNSETQKYEVVVTISDKEQEPTKQQTVTVTSDRPITKWDRLIEKDGQIGWEYGGKEIVFDGSENGWLKQGTGSQPQYYIKINDAENPYTSPFIGNFYCDKFTTVNNFGSLIGAWKVRRGTSGGVFSPVFETDSSINSISLWLEFLSGNSIHCFYKLQTPIYVPLPSEEQEALRDLQTYYPTSIISNDQECQMDVTYAMDTKTYIDKKFEELQSALVTTNSILLGGE